MNYFRKYALFVFFFLAILVQIRAPFVPFGVVKNLFYGFFFFSAFFVFLQLITNPKIFLHPAFRLLALIWLTYLAYMILFDHTYNGLAYVILKGVFFSTIAISIYYYYDYYLEKFPKFIVLIALISLVIGIFVHHDFGGRYGGILGNPNTVGYLSALALGIMILSEDFSIKKLLLMFFLMIMVFISGSRGALLGVGLALILRNFSLKNILLISFLAIFALIINVIAAKYGFMTGLDRVIETGGGLTSREMTNLYGYKTLMLSPFTGFGLDKYAFISAKVIPVQLKYILVPNPHNSFMGLFIQLGIPLASWVMLLLTYYLLRILFSKPYNKIVLFMVLYTFIAGMFESILFGISGFEGFVFWISISLYMMYIYKQKTVST
ncbi:hypothetical protein NNO_0451 [Hydrogenimonas sp.]|nr:hypothetical protein NNO_0451 [Hydrogenimonas sp.]